MSLESESLQCQERRGGFFSQKPGEPTAGLKVELSHGLGNKDELGNEDP